MDNRRKGNTSRQRAEKEMELKNKITTELNSSLQVTQRRYRHC
jgi:hypothetical protein